MSALLVEDLPTLSPVASGPASAVRPAPARTPQSSPARWRHVGRSPQAHPRVTVLPGGRPEGVRAPQLADRAVQQPAAARAAVPGWQLTERGIAVVVMFFLAVVATAAVVLVTSFLSVSDAPTAPAVAPAAALAG